MNVPELPGTDKSVVIALTFPIQREGGNNVDTITLSYTFYPVREPAPKPVASGEPDRRKGNL